MKKLFFAGLAALLIIGAYRFYTGSLKSPLNPEKAMRMIVEVPSGATASDIADILYEKALIGSPFTFKLYLKQKGFQEKIKAGTFVLSPGQSPAEIAEALVSGKPQEFPVTLLEGWTLAQMAEHLETLGLTTQEKFLDCLKTCTFTFDFLPKKHLEGYLYPDTYFVDPASFTESGFIRRLIQTFRNKLDDDWRAIKKSGRTLDQIVIMASIVEREEGEPEERPRVAGILWKRLDASRGLDADATILYALGRTKGGLNYEDLQTNSLYNTRKYRGLPPGPISNPSLSSLRAALYPEITPYWYYLHDSKGEVHYGKTLEAHNENKANYLR